MLNERSIKALEFVHPDLVRVAHKGAELSPIPFIVTEGLRTLERQKILFAKGATRTLKSQHLPHPSDGLSRAFDFVPVVEGEITWKTSAFKPVIAAIKQASKMLDVPITSGGDWLSFKDYPHIEMRFTLRKYVASLAK
jgi:peptidoglycan L-alanyl-D-glutamate endopeptidase CwlK